MFENLIATLKADKRKIVFTEGPDPRILEAASRLKKDGLLDSIPVSYTHLNENAHDTSSQATKENSAPGHTS